MERIFISSVQKELAAERKALKQYIQGDALLRRFSDIPELTGAVGESLADYLVSKGLVQDRPFEEQPCPGHTPADLDPEAVRLFVCRARQLRQFAAKSHPLSIRTPWRNARDCFPLRPHPGSGFRRPVATPYPTSAFHNCG